MEAKTLIGKKDLPRGVVISFGTKKGYVALIQDSGTPYYQALSEVMQRLPKDSTWQAILTELAEKVPMVHVSGVKGQPPGFIAAQQPVHFTNSTEIPLEDKGRNSKFNNIINFWKRFRFSLG